MRNFQTGQLLLRVMQSEIFNYINTGAYVKQVILILFETLKETYTYKMHMACANTIGSDQFAHPIEFKVNIHSLPYIRKRPIITETADWQFP